MKIKVERGKEIDPWEAWLIRSIKNENLTESNYDKLCELAVSSYDLDSRSRKMDHQDLVTYMCIWWNSNKRFMKKYTSLASIGFILGERDHASVYHHIRAFSERKPGRKVSYKYDENIKSIKDFLES
jgi:hypothetical protein